MYHQPQYGNAQFPNQNPVPPVNETLTQNDHTAAGALENFEDVCFFFFLFFSEN